MSNVTPTDAGAPGPGPLGKGPSGVAPSDSITHLPRDDREAYTLPPDAPPVVAELRAREGTLVVGAGEAGERWTVRVEVPEVWDVVRLDVPAAAPVAAVKRAALATLMSGTADADDYAVKLDGSTLLDERASLAGVGAKDGSIFLVTHRRRRAVR